jgi:hypothetical protein
MTLVYKIQCVFNFNVTVIHVDGEHRFGNDLSNICSRLEIIYKLTLPEHSEQNGLIESHNHVVTL